MADDPRYDLTTEQPNKLLDAYRRQILAALEQAKASAAGVDDNYWLADLAFSLIDSALADVSALTTRVAALEPPPAPDPEVP